MKQNKEFLKLLMMAIDNVAEGISIADAAKEDLPLVYVNEGFCKLTGYTAEEVIGRNCRFLQGPDSNQKEVNKIRESIKEQKSCIVELLNYKKDSTTFWNRLSFVPLFGDNKKLTSFVGIQSDITKEKILLKEESELNAMRTTLQSVNDIVFNFMNTLQLVKMHLEEDPSANKKVIAEFNSSFKKTLRDLKKLNTVERFKEKKVSGNIKMIDTD